MAASSLSYDQLKATFYEYTCSILDQITALPAAKLNRIYYIKFIFNVVRCKPLVLLAYSVLDVVKVRSL